MHAQVEPHRPFPDRPTPAVPRGRRGTIATIRLLREER